MKTTDLDKLREALRVIDRLNNFDDAVYDVRENIDWEAEPFDGSSWDHPRTKAYGEAVSIVYDFLYPEDQEPPEDD